MTSTRAMAEAAGRRGVDVDALLARHGTDRAFLADPKNRLPVPVTVAIWQEATALSGEPELPVWAAIELPWGAYRVIDALAAAATVAGEGLESIARYFRILNEVFQVTVERGASGGGTVRIARRDGAPGPAPYVDFTLASCIYRFLHAGARLHPEVHLRRPPPADRTAHEQAFGPALHFGADDDVVVLSEAVWSAPLPRHDPVLRSVLAEHADEMVAGLPAPAPDPLAEVVGALREALPKGRTELPYVAGQLGLSARTLQRRLADRDTTWSDLLAATRRQLSERLLADPSLTVDEVAVLLGYAEASTFHRAFHRWTGTTPGAWRGHRA